MRFRQLALLSPSRKSTKPTLMGPLHKCCVYSNQNGTMAYNLYVYIRSIPHPQLGYFLSVQNRRAKIHKHIKYTKYRQYIPLDFKRVPRIGKSDYLFRNVCPPAWNSPPPGNVFMKFDTCVFFGNCRENSGFIKICREPSTHFS